MWCSRKDICKQFDQDKVVWDRQKYLPNALVCDGDGPIGKFRKWYSDFYVEELAEAAENKGVSLRFEVAMKSRR